MSGGTRCTFGVLPWPTWRQRGSENRGAQCGCWGGDAGVGAGDALGPAPEAPPRGPAPEALRHCLEGRASRVSRGAGTRGTWAGT